MRKVRDLDAWSSGTALVLAMQSASCTGHALDVYDMLRKEEQSKPWMVRQSDGGPLPLDISIAHDEGVIACLSSRYVPIGIDTLSVTRAAASFVSEGGMAVLSRRVPSWLVDWVRQQQETSRTAGATGGKRRLDHGMAYAAAWTLLEGLAKARGESLYSASTRTDMFSAELIHLSDEHTVPDSHATDTPWSLDLRSLPFDPSGQMFCPHRGPDMDWTWPPSAELLPYEHLLSWTSSTTLGQQVTTNAWSAKTVYLPSVDQVMTVVALDGLRGDATAWRKVG